MNEPKGKESTIHHYLKLIFEILRILEIFDVFLTKFKNNQILHSKISTDFYQQPSYLVSERASLSEKIFEILRNNSKKLF